jgi:hypothetical protein
MNVPDRFFDAGDDCSPMHQAGGSNAIQHLLIGLERQKEELGPIADELISLLYRLGVGQFARNVAATTLPQAKPKP